MLLTLFLWAAAAWTQMSSQPPPQPMNLHIEWSAHPEELKVPEYPPEALAANVSGVVDVQVAVDRDGKILQTRIDKPNATLAALERVSLDAVAHSTFRAPVDQRGGPVATLSIVHMTFTARGADGRPIVTASMAPPLLAVTRTLPGRPEGEVFTYSSPGLRTPVVIRRIDPTYTSDAMHAKIVGEVRLDAIVLPDGTIADLRVKKSLDDTHGLDQAAMLAASYWLFSPAMVGNRPVACSVVIVMEFILH